MFKITNFNITGLYGYRNINLDLKDNLIILIGENGLGKSTILRIVYLFLSGKWDVLIRDYNFKTISLQYDNEKIKGDKNNTIVLNKDDFKIKNQNRDLFDNEFLRVFDESVEEYELRNIRRDRDRYRDRDYYRFINEKLLRNNEYKKLFYILNNIKIDYYPTYRRIERDIKNVVRDNDNREFDSRESLMLDSYISRNIKSEEIIGFGMRDVEINIQKTTQEIRKLAVEGFSSLTMHYLSYVVNKEYEKVKAESIKNIKDEEINLVLSRIDDKILTKENILKIENIIKNIRDGKNIDIDPIYKSVILHYFLKLLEFQKMLETKEEKIVKFCKICNSYFGDKEIIYNNSNFEVYIRIKGKDVIKDKEQKIDFNSLSSGEKQVVSIFSKLYLSAESDQSIFILIDEPELSLSVKWQKKILVDIQYASACLGLIAVTHSPFVFKDDYLFDHVHSLGEFEKEEI